MSKSALLELADRVAKASGPDRELDAEIVVALDLRPDWCRNYGTEIYVDPLGPDPSGEVAVLINTTGGKRSRGHPPIGAYPHYTSSLDAAMSLVPEGMEIDLTDRYGIARAIVGANTERGGEYAEHLGGDLALALTAACLRARANQEKTDA